MRNFLLTLFISILILSNVYSEKCGKWEKRDNISCILGDGVKSDSWERECTEDMGNRCLQSNYANQCVKWVYNGDICLSEDPNYLSAPCTKWREAKNFSCGNTKLWVRECKVGYEKESLCYDEDPTSLSSKGGCSEWFKENGVSCANSSGALVQKWARVCTTLFNKEDACTNNNPN